MTEQIPAHRTVAAAPVRAETTYTESAAPSAEEAPGRGGKKKTSEDKE